MKALDEINEDLVIQERDLMPKIKDIGDLERDVEDMLKKNKRRKIDEAVKKSAKCD